MKSGDYPVVLSYQAAFSNIEHKECKIIQADCELNSNMYMSSPVIVLVHTRLTICCALVEGAA